MGNKSMSRRSMLKISAAGSAFLAAQPLLSNPMSGAGKPDENLQALIMGLCSDDPLIQAHCATLLGQLKAEEAVEPLMRYVADCRYLAKTAGLNALMEIRDAKSLTVVLSLIEKPNVPIDRHWMHSVVLQSAAAFTALLLGRKEGIEFFEANKDLPKTPTGEQMQWGVSTFCIWYAPYILQLPDTGADMDYMRELVKARIAKKNQHRPNQVVRVAQALGHIKGKEAAEDLKWYLSAFQSRYIRGAAAENLLAADLSAENVSLVSDAYKNDTTDFVKIKAAAGLLAAGKEDHTDYIISQATNAPDTIDRTTAMTLLGEISSSAGNAALKNNLKHNDPYVRLCAVEALENPGAGAKEVTALAASDPDTRVQLQVAKYLLVQKGRV